MSEETRSVKQILVSIENLLQRILDTGNEHRRLHEQERAHDQTRDDANAEEIMNMHRATHEEWRVQHAANMEVIRKNDLFMDLQLQELQGEGTGQVE